MFRYHVEEEGEREKRKRRKSLKFFGWFCGGRVCPCVRRREEESSESSGPSRAKITNMHSVAIVKLALPAVAYYF